MRRNNGILLKLTAIFFINCVLNSCNHRPESLRDYFKDAPLKISSERVLQEDALIGNPLEMVLIDSILILDDKYKGKHFSVIDIKNRKLIRRFGDIGNGPNELLTVGLIGVNNNKERLLLYNPNERAVIEYSMADVISQEVPVYKKILQMKVSSKGNLVFSLTLLCHRGMPGFLGVGAFESGRYAEINLLGDIENIFGTIPRSPKQESLDNFTIGKGYQGFLKSHPNQDKTVFMALSCDLIEVVKRNSPDDFEILRFQSRFPELNIHNGRVGHGRSNPLGFVSACTTDKYIYGLYSGKTFNDAGPLFAKSDILYVFDWDLNPVQTYKLDHQIQCIAVSEDDKELYSTAVVNDDMQLVKWNMEH